MGKPETYPDEFVQVLEELHNADRPIREAFGAGSDSRNAIEDKRQCRYNVSAFSYSGYQPHPPIPMKASGGLPFCPLYPSCSCNISRRFQTFDEMNRFQRITGVISRDGQDPNQR